MKKLCRECLARTKPTLEYLLYRAVPVVAEGGLAWRVDEGFIEAAIREGCDPCLCHACERPILPGQVISLGMVSNPDGDPSNPNVAAITHLECSELPMGNKTEWRKKHGRQQEA